MTTQTKTTGQEFLLTDLNHGIMQHPLTIPEEGLLVRLTVEDERLKARFEEEVKQQPDQSLPMITWALERSQVSRRFWF
jgi:hypothetical protein